MIQARLSFVKISRVPREIFHHGQLAPLEFSLHLEKMRLEGLTVGYPLYFRLQDFRRF